MYSSTLPSTSALERGGSQRHAPAALSPGNTWYPLYRRLCGPQGRAVRVRKILPPPGFDPRLSYRGPPLDRVATKNACCLTMSEPSSRLLQGHTNLLISKLQDSRRITGSKFHTEETQTVGVFAQNLVARALCTPVLFVSW